MTDQIDLYLGLGSSSGDRKANLHRALELLDKALDVHYDAVSDFIETEPWGFDSPDMFLNAAVRYVLNFPDGTDAGQFAHDILDKCKAIERQLGRTDVPEYDKDGRRVYHSRIIDIDILLLGNLHIDEEDLKIPHPLMHEREFVTVPLRQIIKDVRENAMQRIFI